jgi:hypothetical protein
MVRIPTSVLDGSERGEATHPVPPPLPAPERRRIASDARTRPDVTLNATTVGEVGPDSASDARIVHRPARPARAEPADCARRQDAARTRSWTTLRRRCFRVAQSGRRPVGHHERRPKAIVPEPSPGPIGTAIDTGCNRPLPGSRRGPLRGRHATRPLSGQKGHRRRDTSPSTPRLTVVATGARLALPASADPASAPRIPR